MTAFACHHQCLNNGQSMLRRPVDDGSWFVSANTKPAAFHVQTMDKVDEPTYAQLAANWRIDGHCFFGYLCLTVGVLF